MKLSIQESILAWVYYCSRVLWNGTLLSVRRSKVQNSCLHVEYPSESLNVFSLNLIFFHLKSPLKSYKTSVIRWDWVFLPFRRACSLETWENQGEIQGKEFIVNRLNKICFWLKRVLMFDRNTSRYLLMTCKLQNLKQNSTCKTMWPWVGHLNYSRFELLIFKMLNVKLPISQGCYEY